MKIEAVVFDMDGVLIDSEPLWRKAEIAIFGRRGIPLTEEDCKRLMGLRTDEVVNQIVSESGLDLPREEIAREIVEAVCGLIGTEGAVIDTFRDLALQLKQKGMPLAVATSSPMRVVEAVLKRAGLEDTFRTLVSAEKFPLGKPHPQVYIEACARLGKKPLHCMAIEDSLNGTLAAKAARMQVISVPEPDSAGNKGFGIADFVAGTPREAADLLLSLL